MFSQNKMPSQKINTICYQVRVTLIRVTPNDIFLKCVERVLHNCFLLYFSIVSIQFHSHFPCENKNTFFLNPSVKLNSWGEIMPWIFR